MSDNHINPGFDQSLGEIKKQKVAIEELLLQQFDSLHQTFSEMSVELAKQVRHNDHEINEIQRQLDKAAVDALMRYQPMAEDLRFVVGALKKSSEYERIGDYIKNTAKSISRIAINDEELELLPFLITYLNKIRAYFNDYRAMAAGDIKQDWIKLWLKDELLDEMYTDAVKKAIDFMRAGNGNEHSLVHSVNVAKNFERIGDKIKNLIEITYHTQTGEEFPQMEDYK